MIVSTFHSTCKTSRRVRVIYTLKHHPDKQFFRWFTDAHHARKFIADLKADPLMPVRSVQLQRVGV